MDGKTEYDLSELSDDELEEEFNPDKHRAEIIKTLVEALRITNEDLLGLLTSTDLIEGTIPVFANGFVLDEIDAYYGEPMKYRIWIIRYLEERLSKGRMSRIEILEAARTMNEGDKHGDMEQERSMFRRIFSKH